MSDENVKVVLEAFRRFQGNDFDGMAALYRPDSRITAPEGWPEPGPFEGRDAVMDQFRRLAADWGEQGFSDVELAADRADWVVFTFQWDVRGAESGIASTAKMAVACRMEGAQIAEGHYRWSREEALEAAGLSE